MIFWKAELLSNSIKLYRKSGLCNFFTFDDFKVFVSSRVFKIKKNLFAIDTFDS